MWNTTNNVNKTSINTPASGIIQKSNPKSFFVNVHHRSTLANELFCYRPTYERVRVAILQILLMKEDWIIVELVNEQDL